ncbi:DMT family transporter [Lacticaseibacillus manihotivorans]|uniref:DMT family transporter n=1 Tax=Lacticaseibacillus manihotivorans TaxID=88233 RepID=UPI000AFD82A0|nr:EamA family transporter [Lacticaseibacillus manihotivorans]
MKQNKIIGALYLSFAASIWGGMFVIVKDIVGQISPIQLVWLRYLVAAPVLLLFCLVMRIDWHWRKQDVGLMILIGLIGNTLSIVTQETGTWLSSAQLGSVVTAATPAFMVLFSWGLLKVRPTRGDWLSLIFAMLGVICIVGLSFSVRGVLLGALMLMIAALTWALMSVLIRKVSPDVNALQVTLVGVLVALITLTPWVLMHAQVLAGVNFFSLHVGLSLLYLGAISTASAFVMWNVAFGKWPATYLGCSSCFSRSSGHCLVQYF